MSAIVFDHLRFDTEAPTTVLAKVSPKYCREEEFRRALDGYIAGYWKQNAITADTRRRAPQATEGNT